MMKSLSSFGSGRWAGAATLALAALSVAPASAAQDVIGAGSVVSGEVAQGTAHCWLLPTEPGQRWRIQLDGDTTYVAVGRGSCEAFVLDRGDYNGAMIDRIARLDFASGGGVYVIKGQGFFQQAVAYTLRVQQLPGIATSGFLPAGSPIQPWLTAGWTPPSVSSAPASGAEGLRRGNVFKDCADVCPEMVVIPAGSFTMGSPAEEAGRDASEGPRHPVALVNAFAIGRYEVTFTEYDACVTDGGCTHRPNDQGWGRGRRPVVDVNWNDAQAYAAWLSQKTGKRYTLPSESEWEYAARAGANTPWQTGRAILTDDANILNAFGRTVPTGSYPPNAFGLHDVHGNPQEWVLDCLDTGYVGTPNDGSAATSGRCAEARLVRGGYFGDEPARVRFAARAVAPQTTRNPGIGFRVTRAL